MTEKSGGVAADNWYFRISPGSIYRLNIQMEDVDNDCFITVLLNLFCGDPNFKRK